MNVRRRFLVGLAAVALVTLSACSNSNSGSTGSNGNSPSPGSKGTIQLSGQNFDEMEILAYMYQDVLQNAGYKVDIHLVTTRDIYVPQLKTGAVDIAPDYLAGMADYLNQVANGANAPELSTHSPSETLAKMKSLATAAGITMLQPAKATDQNAFAVTTAFAQAHHISTLSQLAALHLPITLAAASDCEGRSDCQAGLANVYGLNITKILPLGFDSAETKNSVEKGESQLGEVATTDGALASEGLTLLQDDKGIQPAQNLIPAVNTAFLKAHPDIAGILNKLSSTLTTADLSQLDLDASVDRMQPQDIATAYLQSHGLIPKS